MLQDPPPPPGSAGPRSQHRTQRSAPSSTHGLLTQRLAAGPPAVPATGSTVQGSCALQGGRHCNKEGVATRKALQQGRCCNKEGIATRKALQQGSAIRSLQEWKSSLQQELRCNKGGGTAAGWVAVRGAGLQHRMGWRCKSGAAARGKHVAKGGALQRGGILQRGRRCSKDLSAVGKQVAGGRALQRAQAGEWVARRRGLQWGAHCKGGQFALGNGIARESCNGGGVAKRDVL